MLRRRPVDSKLEKKIVWGLITSTDFLSAANTQIEPDLFKSTHLRMIVRWCLEYWQSYAKCPSNDLEQIYYRKVDSGRLGEEDAAAIRIILKDLGGEPSDSNTQYLLDELQRWLLSRKLSVLGETIEDSLHQGDVAGALQATQSFRAPTIGVGVGLRPLNDPQAWDFAFAEFQEPLIELPGDAGTFFAPALVREGFIGIQAPEKRGKTFWCLEFTIRAVQQRRKVAFFAVGDLSERQMLLRLGVRLTRLPMWASQRGSIRIPTKIAWPLGGRGVPEIEYRVQECASSVSQEECVRAAKRFAKIHAVSRRPALLISVHPTWSINVQGIESILDGWEVEYGFVPDVVIVDYADILAPEEKRSQSRDMVNETWAKLRRLSQQRRCLVISPTQADAASYDRNTQTMGNFSEDKRKLSHSTGMLGLNQNDEEKELGIMRLNWLLLREAPFATRRCLWVGQCIPLGRAMCCSSLPPVVAATDREDTEDEDLQE